MKILLKNIGTLLFLSLFVAFSSCESDKWNEHYSVDPALVPGATVWETIRDTPRFSKFAWAVKRTGFDKTLDGAQMFTVWVPDNSAAGNIDTTDTSIDNEMLLKEYVQNHVAKFSYTASGDRNTKIMLLNKKQLTFHGSGGSYFVDEVAVKDKNIVSSNGIIHVVESRIPFFTNIWEYLSKGSEMDSIRTFLFSFNKLFFDEAKSIPGDVNENGETVYLDSVIYNYNIMFWRLGALNDEDSTYTAVLPTNTAWKTSYAKIKDYYNFYFASEATRITADTLQRKYSLSALTRDLVFSHTIQNMNNDTLISTNKNKFYKPFDNALLSLPASNGRIYVTDNINYQPWESFHQDILVEAERSVGRNNTWSNIFERNYVDLEFSVSRNRYIEVTPSIASVNPTVTFSIPNTLSGKLNADQSIMKGGAYNIYCVFLPNKLRSPQPKPNKVTFTLTYQSEDRGRIVNVNYNGPDTGYVVDANNLTKLLVASNVVFPYSEYGLDIPNVKFRVSSKVAANETTTYSREMLIDCVIFEPVR